ncbi:MAG TPA: hypothetical protein VLD40_07210 [Dissulfurispiraceae bacterium]|nr:hypothetical protein [Dissulfurispiraceae bacterium]
MKRFLLLCTCALVSLCLLPLGGDAAVVVDDEVAVKGEPLTLVAQTKGRFFGSGGELVEFLMDGVSLGKTLSGGDGFAYREFTPTKAGMHSITVISKNESGHGSLLILKKGARLVLVDGEGAVMEGRLMGVSREGSQEALRAIVKRYPIVFVATGLGRRDLKEWLRDHGFIDAPVVDWDDGRVLSDLTGKGFRIRAVIGAAEVVRQAKGHAQLLLSFEESEGVREVTSWKEIIKKLK